MLTIGALAGKTGVSKDTVRFYERSGLLSSTGRTTTGYRLYDAADVERIQFIKDAQLCGLALETIRELLEPVTGSHARACRAYRAAVAESEPLERRIEALLAMRQRLTEFIRRCDGDGPATVDILSAAEAAVPDSVPWPVEMPAEPCARRGRDVVSMRSAAGAVTRTRAIA